MKGWKQLRLAARYRARQRKLARGAAAASARGLNMIRQGSRGAGYGYSSGSYRYGGYGRQVFGDVERGPGINLFMKKVNGGVNVYQDGEGDGEGFAESVGRDGAGTSVYQVGGYPRGGSYRYRVGGGGGGNGGSSFVSRFTGSNGFTSGSSYSTGNGGYEEYEYPDVRVD